MTEEGLPSLGRDGSTYQEYIVPAFLTQVDELDAIAVDVAVAVAVVGVDVAVDAYDQALVEMVPLLFSHRFEEDPSVVEDVGKVHYWQRKLLYTSLHLGISVHPCIHPTIQSIHL